MKQVAIFFSLLFISAFAFGQMQNPYWNVLDSPAVFRSNFNSLLLKYSAGMKIVDSGIREASYGVGMDYITYTYKCVDQDTFSIKYIVYNKGADADLKEIGIPSIKEIVMTGHYLSLAPFYIGLFAPDQSPETLKNQPKLYGWFSDHGENINKQWMFQKDGAETWRLRIFNRW